MSFRDNLVKARSHIVFIVALICGLFAVTALEKRAQAAATDSQGSDLATAQSVSPLFGLPMAYQQLEPVTLRPTGSLSEQEYEYARTAWTYFENNTNPSTGLANSVDGYPSTTMWETGSYFVAVISASLLDLIEQQEAETRLRAAIQTLATIRLFDDILPNKAYNARTGELVDYSNQPVERGLGWSALDIARMVAALNYAENHFPGLSPDIAAVFQHWSLDDMVAAGELVGGNLIEGQLRRDQEGRVGYGQYAAKAMMLMGFDVYNAYHAEANLMVRYVDDNPIAVDRRLHRNVTPAFAVSEPYLFDGLEFGLDSRSHLFATGIYQAQEDRWEATQQLTAVSESHIDEAPYFVYSTVWGGGADWAVMTFAGDRADSKRTVTVKTAFAWDALFGTDYTVLLVDALAEIADPERGWPEGIYEIDGTTNGSTTANTNATVLASLAYRVNGPIRSPSR